MDDPFLQDTRFYSEQEELHLTLLHSHMPKLNGVLACVSAIGLKSKLSYMGGNS